MATEIWSLADAWTLRNTAVDVLLRSEQQMQRLVQTANSEQLIHLVETFTPTRSRGPEWTRTFDPLVERLWAWCTPRTMAELEATFRARGPAWNGVANAFSAPRGAELRQQVRHPSWARYPAYALA